MTTPNGAILFNATSGSDTQASGLGPATARTGSGASITSASSTVTGIDTTNVIAGDLLWVQSSSGRQFSIIQSITSSSEVVCDEVFDVTESGRTWAIGGRRATFEDASSRRLFGLDSRQDLTTATETDQIITTALGYADATSRIKSANSTQKKLTLNGAGQTMFSGGHFILSDLSLQAIDGNDLAYSDTSNAAIGTTRIKTYRCTIGGYVTPFSTFSNSPSASRFTFSKGTHVLNVNDSSGYSAPQDKVGIVSIDGCFFKDCGRIQRYGDRTPIYISNSVFVGRGTESSQLANTFYYQRYKDVRVSKCIFYNYYAVFTGSSKVVRLRDVIFHTTTYPVASGTTQREALNIYSYNAQNIRLLDDITYSEVSYTALEKDPFVDVTALDFNINNVEGGGAVIRSAHAVL